MARTDRMVHLRCSRYAIGAVVALAAVLITITRAESPVPVVDSIDSPAGVLAQIIQSPEDEADDRGFIFRVTSPGGISDRGIYLQLATSGTMTPEADFVPPPLVVYLHAGDEWIDVQIKLIDDDENEGTETLALMAIPISSTSQAGKQISVHDAGQK